MSSFDSYNDPGYYISESGQRKLGKKKTLLLAKKTKRLTQIMTALRGGLVFRITEFTHGNKFRISLKKTLRLLNKRFLIKKKMKNNI